MFKFLFRKQLTVYDISLKLFKIATTGKSRMEIITKLNTLLILTYCCSSVWLLSLIVSSNNTNCSPACIKCKTNLEIKTIVTYGLYNRQYITQIMSMGQPNTYNSKQNKEILYCVKHFMFILIMIKIV